MTCCELEGGPPTVFTDQDLDFDSWDQPVSTANPVDVVSDLPNQAFQPDPPPQPIPTPPPQPNPGTNPRTNSFTSHKPTTIVLNNSSQAVNPTIIIPASNPTSKANTTPSTDGGPITSPTPSSTTFPTTNTATTSDKPVSLCQEWNLPEGRTNKTHPTLCHRYLDCSDDEKRDKFSREGLFLQKNERECPFPQLFSDITGRCEHFSMVDCGVRLEFKDKCDYSTSWCLRSIRCPPCDRSLYRSCANQPDGRRVWKSRELSGFYVNCESNRAISTGNCIDEEIGQQLTFSSDTLQCELYEDTIIEICHALRDPTMWPEAVNNFHSADGLLSHRDCHRYYNCSHHTQSLHGTPLAYVMTCPYPQYFSLEKRRCMDYQDVECLDRRNVTSP